MNADTRRIEARFYLGDGVFQRPGLEPAMCYCRLYSSVLVFLETWFGWRVLERALAWMVFFSPSFLFCLHF